MTKLTRILSVGVAALALGLGATACGGGEAAEPGSTRDGIALYTPSKIVSDAGGSTTLNSPDSLGKVSDFYLDQVDKGGWNTVSKSVGDWNTSLTLKKGDRGASVSVSRLLSGTTISISTYPAP